MKYRSCPICGGFCGGGWRTGRYPLCNRVPANHSFKKNGVSKIMTDKELLELAAKAAGIEIEENGLHWNFTQDPAELREWNPLTDDGDALRLAVKLNLAIQQLPGRNECEAWHNGSFAKEPHESDPYAATRRAIVRAAAEIWNNMND